MPAIGMTLVNILDYSRRAIVRAREPRMRTGRNRRPAVE